MNTVNKIKHKVTEIWIDEEGILILKCVAEEEIDLEEVTKCFETYKALGIGPHNKVLQLIDARIGSAMPSDARAYAAENGKDFFIASAIVNDSLAVKLLVNFFNNFYKQLVPFKMFSTEEAARKWLNTFR